MFEARELLKAFEDNYELGFNTDLRWWLRRRKDNYTSQPFSSLESLFTALLTNEVDWSE